MREHCRILDLDPEDQRELAAGGTLSVALQGSAVAEDPAHFTVQAEVKFAVAVVAIRWSKFANLSRGKLGRKGATTTSAS